MIVQIHKPSEQAKHSRRGVLIPLVAISLLTIMAGVALALNQLWIDAAKVELTTAAESAALAAGRELASEDLLRDFADPETLKHRAREAAANITSVNSVAGTGVNLNLDPENGDLTFGTLVLDKDRGKVLFLETNSIPTTVVVTAHKHKTEKNPVAMLMGQLTGEYAAGIIRRAEATINNRLIGVRPYTSTPVPALPLAVLGIDLEGKRTDTWQNQIVNRVGGDHYSWDEESGLVREQPDGIPEMRLLSKNPQSQISEDQQDISNVRLLNLGTDYADEQLQTQIQKGWSSKDLKETEGKLELSLSEPTEMHCTSTLSDAVQESLRTMIGKQRILVLYSRSTLSDKTNEGNLEAVAFVAVRILQVTSVDRSTCEILIQPTVMTTRTAIIAATSEAVTSEPTTEQPNEIVYRPSFADNAPSTLDVPRNPYIYKLHLTQ